MDDDHLLQYLKVEINEDETEGISMEEELSDGKIGIEDDEGNELMEEMAETLLYLKEDVVEDYDGGNMKYSKIGSASKKQDLGSDSLLQEYTSLRSKLNTIQDEENNKTGKSVFPNRKLKQVKTAITQRMKLIATQWRIESNVDIPSFNTYKLIKSRTEPQLSIVPKDQGGKPVEEVFVKLKVPSAVGKSAVREDIKISQDFHLENKFQESEKRKQKKIVSERQRRAGINKLIEVLDHWVDECEGGDNSWIPNKVSYCDRVNRATRCIRQQERELAKKEAELTMLHWEHAKLQAQLIGNEPHNIILSGSTKSVWPGLYTCKECHAPFNTLSQAFSHEQVIHARGLSKEVEEMHESYNCTKCPKVYENKDLLDIHSLLHLDLTYFQCPDCPLVFGLPSKLKRHMFLDHGKLVGNEADYLVDMRTRVKISNKIQNYMVRLDDGQLEVVENFFEASLDAKLILDEINIEEDGDSILNHLKHTKLMTSKNYLKTEDNEKSDIKIIEETDRFTIIEETDKFTSEEIDAIENDQLDSLLPFPLD